MKKKTKKQTNSKKTPKILNFESILPSKELLGPYAFNNKLLDCAPTQVSLFAPCEYLTNDQFEESLFGYSKYDEDMLPSLIDNPRVKYEANYDSPQEDSSPISAFMNFDHLTQDTLTLFIEN